MRVNQKGLVRKVCMLQKKNRKFQPVVNLIIFYPNL